MKVFILKSIDYRVTDTLKEKNPENIEIMIITKQPIK